MENRLADNECKRHVLPGTTIRPLRGAVGGGELEKQVSKDSRMHNT